MKCVLLIFALYFCKASALNWCQSDAECSVQDTHCSPWGVCICQPGKVLSKDNTKCLEVARGPKYECEIDEQCDWIVGPSICKRGTCSCSAGYRYLHDKCIATSNFDKECVNNEDCFDGMDFNSLVCDKKKCTCNAGYYKRADVDCRQIAYGLNDTCVFDNDCFFEEAICDNGICLKPGNKTDFEEFEEHRQNVPRASVECQQNDDCASIENSYCVQYLQECVCKQGYAFVKSLGKCVPALGEKCVNNTCEIDNSVCKQGICQCKNYFIPGNMNEKCYKPIRKIGYSCAHDNNCYSFGTNAICSDKKCMCDEKSKFDSEFNLCKPTNGDNTCTSNVDCAYKEYSICEANECKCKQHYRETDGKCYPNLGVPCDSDCILPHAICDQDKICSCEDNFLANGELQCIEKLPNVTSECEVKVQCEMFLGPYSDCINKTCSCGEDSILRDGACFLVRYLGDVCTRRMDCEYPLNQTLCRNGICSCEYGYKNHEDRMHCVADNGGSSVISGSGALLLLLQMYVIRRFVGYS